MFGILLAWLVTRFLNPRTSAGCLTCDIRRLFTGGGRSSAVSTAPTPAGRRPDEHTCAAYVPRRDAVLVTIFVTSARCMRELVPVMPQRQGSQR